MTSFSVNTTCSFISLDGIKKVEEKYNAKYVLESCLKMKTGWANFPVAIFYTEEAHPEGSNYFAVYRDADGVFGITNGLSAVDDVTFAGLEAEGEVVYSRYRHDFRESKNGAFVDGGRDYFKYGGDPFNDYNIVKFKVEKNNLTFI